ncbi:hypothetical protein M3Y95_00361300 [Aphelenchoides besseyi]|nr:hypothetical protein M3Y95_00361300 [Aphelenchoides besseyi]
MRVVVLLCLFLSSWAQEDASTEQSTVATDPLIDFLISGPDRNYALDPLLWNTTANSKISIFFNFSANSQNGRLLTIVGREPLERTFLFKLEVDYTFGNLKARLKDLNDHTVDSVRFQVGESVASINETVGFYRVQVTQEILVGTSDGDLRLKIETSELPLIQLHSVLGADEDAEGLQSEGFVQINGVEVTSDELDLNSTISPESEVDRWNDLLKSGGISVPEFLRKYHNNDMGLDEKSRMALSCSAQEKSLCENANFCFRPNNSSFFRCVCREGFGGQFCQFSLFPSTCAEALRSEKTAGIFQLDVDGSGPLRSTFAECSRDGKTIVTHNVPNRTKIRDPNDESSKYFPLSYRLFSPLQIRGLKRRSSRCEQSVRYECERAALGFGKNMTWFESVSSDRRISRLGTAAPEKGCLCQTMDCLHHRLCNCEHSEAVGADEGKFVDAEAAIETIFVRRHATPGSAYLTLGPLACWGDAGHANERTWTLKSKSALGILGTRQQWRFLELEFRTHQSEIVQLIGGSSLNVSLVGGHKLELKSTGERANFSLIVMSQAKLNDLKWHRVLIEVVRQEVRFSVDQLNGFYPLEISTFDSELQIGGQNDNGWIGCVRGIRVDHELVNLKETNLMSQRCPDLCLDVTQCEQNSRCIEHFETTTTSCECQNNLVHFGERCEKNINVDTEVSFHDKTIGFLKFLNGDLPANPLNSTILFSARTDQRRALFFYAHDQFDNFVQVHLENEYKIVLTLNNQTDILRCAIYAQDSSEFADMRWLQFAVLQTETAISLQVDDAACELPGRHVLSTKHSSSFDGETEDTILPPQSAAPVVTVAPFRLLFVGGVPRVQRNRKPRASSDQLAEQKRERIAYYMTDIPPLLGCIRGFMIGNQLLDLRSGGIRPNDPDAVRIGCANDCDSLKCQNGGHCAVHWQDYDPADVKLTVCDCSKTSYYGDECTRDTGVAFGGQAALIFDMSEPRRFLLSESEKQSVSFAFVPRARRLTAGAQRLASFRFDDGRQLDVELCKNSSVNLVVQGPRRSDVYTFGGNFTDGYRHFFHGHFIDGRQPLVLVDGEKRFLAEDEPLHLSSVREFWFGGGEETQRHNFEGCMSNIEIDFHRNDAVRFTPLIYYQNKDDFYHRSVRLSHEDALPLAPAECAAFRLVGQLPSKFDWTNLNFEIAAEQRNVQLPVWEAHFMPVYFNDTEEVDFDVQTTDKFAWLVIIGICVLVSLLIVLLVCCCFCFFWYRKNRGSRGTPAAKSEVIKSTISKPMAVKQNEPAIVSDSLTYIKPNQPLLSETEVPKTNSIISNSTYYTAPEQPMKVMSESQTTALDSDDETLTSYDDRPLSVVSEPNVFYSQRQSPPRTTPTLSTFMNADQLQPQRPVATGRFTPVFPSLRRSPKPIDVPTPEVPTISTGHSTLDGMLLLESTALPPKATAEEEDDDDFDRIDRRDLENGN